MNDHIDAPDVLATVARYQPAQLMFDWSAEHADATLLAVLAAQPADGRTDDHNRAGEISPQIASRRSALWLPIGAAVAAVAAVVISLLVSVAVQGDGHHGGAGAGPGPTVDHAARRLTGWPCRRSGSPPSIHK